MTIGAILSGKGHEVISIDASVTTRDAVKLLAERRIGAVPVMDGARVAGIFSERDVVYCLDRVGSDVLDKPVSELMTAPAITVTSVEGVLSALGLMTRRRVRHLPVVDGDVLVGFVSIGDLVKFRIDRIEEEAKSLRDYIQQA